MLSEALRVLVCGSRTFDDAEVVFALLDGLWTECTVGYLVADMHGMTVIEGGARGADNLARWWAAESPMHAHGERGDDDPPFEHLQFPAAWKEHHPDWCSGGRCTDHYCAAAGRRRNQAMIEEGKPNLVVAFVDKPLEESKGTADMVRRARKAGVRTYVVQAIA